MRNRISLSLPIIARRFAARLPSALAIAMAMSMPALASAQAPTVMPLQGYLTDAAGTPIDGATDMAFAIYTTPTGGAPIYVEMQSLMVDGGYFTAYVGDVLALDLATFRDNGTLYVGVRIGSDPELAPRAQLGSVPYAGWAEYAGSVDFADVQGVPAGLADGDDDTTYSAGAGLALAATTFSVDTAAIQARVVGTCPAGQYIRAIDAAGAVTCQAVPASTTYAAGAGLTLTGTTFAVNTTAIQSRVVGTCPAGQAIRLIAADGAVTCDSGTSTSYTAGFGLTLTGTTFAVNNVAVQQRVGGTCPAGQSIRTVNADGTVVCEADDDTNTTYTAGGGLTLTGTVFSVNTAVTQSRVTGTCGPNASIATITATGAVTCETDDSATYTAGAGLTLTGTSFSVDTAAIQARVTGMCPAGQSIATISAAGAVTCEIDTDTTYAAGAGLTLAGTSFSVNTTAIQARVATPCAAGSAIRAIDAAGTPTCEIDDNTAYAAGTGLTLTGTTFAVNTATIQSRVTGTCVAGQSIRVIDAAGNVTCEVDDGTTYTAGQGITITGTSIAWNGLATPTDAFRAGVVGTQAQALGWQPDPGGTPGIWVEDGTVEGGGFFANGNLSAIWSPGDGSYIVSGGTITDFGVLLGIWDEDTLSAGSTALPMFIFGNGGPRAIDTFTQAHLTIGGIWTNSSDRHRKENFRSVDPRDVLARLRRMPISEWNYINEPDSVRHIGPMAQDFHAAFGLAGDDETHIGTVDADGIMMASIVAVADENEDLRDENARLQHEVRDLAARLDRIEALLAR